MSHVIPSASAAFRFIASRRVAGAAGLCGVVTLATGIAIAQTGAGTPSAGKSVKVGPGVYELAVSQSTGHVYVASAGGRGQASGAAVHVLTGDSLDAEGTVDMSAAAPYGVGINDRTQTLYTTNTRAGSVTAIDLKTRKIVNTISTEEDKNAHLREIVADETTNTIYATSYGQEGAIWVIDGARNTLSHLIRNVGNGTTGLVVDPAGKRLYVTNMGANEIAVLDTTTRQVIERYPAGGERPTNLAFDGRTGKLFVANQNPGTLTVLDTRAKGKLLATVPTGAGALDVEYSAPANRIYVANRGAGTVTVLDGTTHAVVAHLQTGSAPNTLALDSTRGLVYVTNKARPGQGRRGGGAAAPATPPPAPAEDPGADTVTVIRP